MVKGWKGRSGIVLPAHPFSETKRSKRVKCQSLTPAEHIRPSCWTRSCCYAFGGSSSKNPDFKGSLSAHIASLRRNTPWIYPPFCCEFGASDMSRSHQQTEMQHRIPPQSTLFFLFFVFCHIWSYAAVWTGLTKRAGPVSAWLALWQREWEIHCWEPCGGRSVMSCWWAQKRSWGGEVVVQMMRIWRGRTNS